MGYKIEYGQTVKFVQQKTKDSNKNLKIAVLVLVLALASAFLLRNDSVRSFILPGDPSVTEEALNTFADQVRAGEPFKDAAVAFCQDIISNADVS